MSVFDKFPYNPNKRFVDAYDGVPRHELEQRLARIEIAAESVLRFLPSSHRKTCREMYDRECGVCDCGADEANALRTPISRPLP